MPCEMFKVLAQLKQQDAGKPRLTSALVPSCQNVAVVQEKLRRMEAELREGKQEPAGHERGAGDWQHYQSPRDILAAVARQNQPRPPGLLPGLGFRVQGLGSGLDGS